MIIVNGPMCQNWPINVGAKLTLIAPLSETKVPCSPVWINKARLCKPDQLLVVPENEAELAAMKRDYYLRPIICETIEEARERLIEPNKAKLRANAVSAARANANQDSELEALRKENAELRATIQAICSKFRIVRAGAGWRQITE